MLHFDEILIECSIWIDSYATLYFTWKKKKINKVIMTGIFINSHVQPDINKNTWLTFLSAVATHLALLLVYCVGHFTLPHSTLLQILCWFIWEVLRRCDFIFDPYNTRSKGLTMFIRLKLWHLFYSSLKQIMDYRCQRWDQKLKYLHICKYLGSSKFAAWRSCVWLPGRTGPFCVASSPRTWVSFHPQHQNMMGSPGGGCDSESRIWN